nr:hypothetical protein [Burkholderia glumae]
MIKHDRAQHPSKNMPVSLAGFSSCCDVNKDALRIQWYVALASGVEVSAFAASWRAQVAGVSPPGDFFGRTSLCSRRHASIGILA